MNTWEKGSLGTCIFEFETTLNSQALLHFTELNCPSENIKEQEENWVKFWKKINGVRVETIKQIVYFKGKNSEMMYEQLTDWKVLSKVLKSKFKFEPNGAVYMHNNKVYALITDLTPCRRFVQQWRSTDWPDDLFSVVTTELENFEGGCRLYCNISMVPLDRVKAVEKIWKSNMWKKLGGVVCQSLNQKIAFQMTPTEVCNLWTTETTLSQKLKSRILTGNTVGSPFQAQNLKGEIAAIEKDHKLVLRVSHKDWAQHVSLVTLVLDRKSVV